MLDIRLIRERADFVKQELAKVGVDDAQVDALLEADRLRRAKITEVESLKAQRGSASKEIAKLPEAERGGRVAEMRALGERISALEVELAAAEAEFEGRMLEVPNLPHPDVPVGPDESANVVIRTVGEERRFDFTPRPHWELGTELGIIDF